MPADLVMIVECYTIKWKVIITLNSLIFFPKASDYLEFDTMMSVLTLNVYDTERK